MIISYAMNCVTQQYGDAMLLDDVVPDCIILILDAMTMLYYSFT